MQKQLKISLTSALVAAFAPMVVVDINQQVVASQGSPITLEENVHEVSFLPQPTSAELETELRNFDPNSTLVATVYKYAIEDKPAATVFVQELPVITFLEEAVEAKANDLTIRLNELHASNFAADKIDAIWDNDRKTIVIKAGEEELLAMTDTTILADSTENKEQDALQITNRLRRLMGGAEPIKTITGMPEPQAPAKPTETIVKQIKGIASWYGPGFHGRLSANGERFNQNALTAAHKSLPFNTMVRVTNLNNNKSVVVRINDRGPYIGGRVIDLSAAAAQAINMTGTGVAPVRVDVLAK